jgi:hypothetical protein
MGTLSGAEFALLSLAELKGYVVVTERPQMQAQAVEVARALEARGLLAADGEVPSPRRQRRLRFVATGLQIATEMEVDGGAART